jgi:transcriptional regulator with XRE-family HTH domain
MSETFQVVLTVRERVRKAREDAGLKQSDLAMRLNVARGTVSGWETGERVPSQKMAKRIAQETGFPTWWLLGYDSLEEAVSTMW